MNVAVCDKLGCKKVADLFPKANELAVREILSSLLFLAPKKLETGKMLVLRKAREAHACCVKITERLFCQAAKLPIFARLRVGNLHAREELCRSRQKFEPTHVGCHEIKSSAGRKNQ